MKSGKRMSLVPKYIEEIEHLLITCQIIKTCYNLQQVSYNHALQVLSIFGREMQLDMAKNI